MTHRPIRDGKALGLALKRDEVTIEVTHTARKTVIKVRALGKVAWGLVLVSASLLIAAIIFAGPSGGTSIGMTPVLGGAGLGILGWSAFTTLVAAGVAAGGPGELVKIRDYKVQSDDGKKMVLVKT